MTQTERDQQNERATGTWIVVKSDDGYRVYSPLTPAQQFLVRDNGDDVTCTCPEFQQHAGDPEWRCAHMLAVFGDGQERRENPETKAPQANIPSNGGAASPVKAKRSTAVRESSLAQMLIKRSVSPDGRIDSLSVEFSVPVGNSPSEDIKRHAERALKLQGDIMQGFLAQNGNRGHRRNDNVPGAEAAQLLNIAAMDTRKGRTLFINILVNNQVAKLFGGQQELREALIAAGYPKEATRIAEGITLNLPCRVTTKQNGKYLNIDRVLPAQNGGVT